MPRSYRNLLPPGNVPSGTLVIEEQRPAFLVTRSEFAARNLMNAEGLGRPPFEAPAGGLAGGFAVSFVVGEATNHKRW